MLDIHVYVYKYDTINTQRENQHILIIITVYCTSHHNAGKARYIYYNTHGYSHTPTCTHAHTPATH